MDALLKAAVVSEGSLARLFRLSAALFHSTPVLERRRRNQWKPLFTYYKTPRSNRWKRNVLRSFNSYGEDFIQNWIPFFEQEDPPNRGPSWFRGQKGGTGSRRQGNPNQGHKARGRRGFEFCDHDNDIDAGTIFRSAFGGERSSFWSFVNEDNACWRCSSTYTDARWHWRIDSDDGEDSSSDTEISESTSASDRLVLGLSPYGPLKLDDVKHAYRTCALKYHPDRHQGPSKNAAEEKFKLCTAAYQSLCDKLAIN